MKIQILILVLCTFLMFCIGCSKEEEKTLPDERIEKLTTVLADLSIGFELAQRDSLEYFPIRDSIFEKHGVDSIWLSNSMDSLGEDPEVWAKVWEAIEGDLESLRDSLTP